MTNVLITGGNGLIGSHLAENLVESGYDVTLIDWKFDQNSERVDCAKIQGDVTDPALLRECGSKPDIVFHAAAMSRVAWGEVEPLKCMAINVGGLTNLLNWASALPRRPFFIFASSREVYGECAHRPVREDHAKNPKSVYGISKLTGERLVEYYSRVRGLRASIVRFSNVYGSLRDLKERVIPKFVMNAVKGLPLTLNGGSQVLDFTHVSDTVKGLVSLIQKAESRDSVQIQTDFHFTTSVGHSVEELAKMVIRIACSPSEVIKVDAVPTDVEWFIGDFSKARRELGYEPKIQLEEGLRKYIGEVGGSL